MTSDGSYVTTVLIPPFNPPPRAIMWGQRVFFHKRGVIYHEDFFYVVPPGMEKVKAS